MTSAAGQWLVWPLTATRLWLPAGCEKAGLLHVSTMCRATSEEWEPGAWVPSGWEPVGAGTFSPADAGEFRPDYDVAVIDLRGRSGDGTPEEMLATAGLVDHLFGLRHDVPGRITTTFNAETDRLVGLHLDNFDRLPAGRRHESRNRINLCLGPDSRGFLFVDVDVASLFPPEETPSSAALRDHEALVAGPRVVWVRVDPGWAYVAPTELLLHDGCSVGQRYGASHVSALGHFAPGLVGPGI